jgi:phosphatidate cytidylyltransferase
MFVTRLATVAISLPLVIAALLFLPQQLWALVMFPVLAIASWEWAGLARYQAGLRWAYAIALVISAAVLFYLVPRAGGMPARIDIGIYALSCIFWLAIAPVWLVKRWAARKPLLLALVGWIVLVPMWLALVQLQAAPWALLLFVSVVWVSDTAAYLTGKRWGRHKLAPLISPGKTWEGALGAAAAVTIYYALLLVVVPAGNHYLEGWWGLVVFGTILVLSVEGDLFESWMKRTAGVKDSGQLLPGHGGILDRIDGLTASMPAAALAFYLR